ncbi:XRE family transcriptional regulator [Bartonella gliris]|uniref:XRE family transcriptional regulator n=1 Tax=Bartonella gliris TaxID=3004109 RepID=UPI0038734698
MLISFGKILRKFHIDHSELLLGVAKKLDISVSFIEIGKKSVPVGMEEKIIELYDFDEETASRLRKEADVCRKNFTINPFGPLNYEISGMLIRNLRSLLQQDLAKLKKINRKTWRKETLSVEEY